MHWLIKMSKSHKASCEKTSQLPVKPDRDTKAFLWKIHLRILSFSSHGGMKKRASSVPASNRDHKKQGLGYPPASSSSNKPYMGNQELNRSGSQVHYPDLTMKSAFDMRVLLKEHGAFNCFSNHGVITDPECWFICWQCGEDMVITKVSKSEPEYRCTSRDWVQ